jgi:hypothetical protein
MSNGYAMARALPTLTPSDLELRLFRKGVGALTAGRDRCADCGRTPLTGERVHLYAGGAAVCALCRPRHGGEPQATEIVRHCEHGHTVKLRAA